MNLPNKLTVTRLVLLPLLLVWYFINVNSIVYAVVLGLLFGAMELTDLLDGKIARKRNLVTDLGKVLDPFADAICHLTFFACFTFSQIMPLWAFIIIFWREFSQSFVRMLLMGKGKPMAANIFGKAKTCLYALCSVCGFAFKALLSFDLVSAWMTKILTVLFALACVASVLSFLIYINNIRKSKILKDMTR